MNQTNRSGPAVTIRRARLLPILLVAALLWLAAGASAHAALESSDPPVDGNAPAGLTVLELRFTEGVERRYTDADVVDLNGTSYKAGPVEFDETRRNVIRVPLRPLGDGIYSASWQTLSVDTHTLRGQFLFSVGSATLVPTGAVVDHDHGAGGEHGYNEGLTRGIFFAGLFAALGIPLFGVAFDTRPRIAPGILRATGAFALVGAAAGILALWYFSDRTSIPLENALSTQAGASLLWRSVLLALSAGAAFAAAAVATPRQKAVALLGVLLAFAAAAATSMGSHAASAAENRGLSILADFLHLTVGGMWIGGVFAFVLSLGGRTAPEAGALVTRFSPAAVGSVIVLIGTGTFASLQHMNRWSEFWSDPYGRLVGLKILLLVPLVLMGAYNQFRVGPALLGGRMAVRRFHRVVEAEALIMITIVVLAGVLSTTPPPDEAAADAAGRRVSEPYSQEVFLDTAHVVVYIEPGPVQVGVQRINVQLHPLTAAGIGNSTQVALKFRAPGEPEPEEIVTPQKITPGDWRLEGGYFTSPGEWKMYVIVQLPDEYEKLVFDVPVTVPGA